MCDNPSTPDGGAEQSCLDRIQKPMFVVLFFVSVNCGGKMDVSVSYCCTVLDRTSRAKFLCYTHREDGTLNVW